MEHTETRAGPNPRKRGSQELTGTLSGSESSRSSEATSREEPAPKRPRNVSEPPTSESDDESSYDSVFGLEISLSCGIANGRMVLKTPEESVQEKKKAAEKGSARAQFKLAQCFLAGYGVPEDHNQANHWYAKAAEQGYVRAQYALARSYLMGLGDIKSDPSKAAQIFTLAAEQGHGESQNNLGLLYMHGLGVAQDPLAAYQWVSKAAQQGCTSAKTNVGVCYAEGYGVEKDISVAREWWTKAAELEEENAQYCLGMSYLKEVETRNPIKAVHWLTKAAEQGFEEAEKILCCLYEGGEGTFDAMDQFMLGECYRTGDGVTRSMREAIRWYTKAAERGFVRAQIMLALSYKDGNGVPQDLSKANEWFRKAAEAGDSYAQNFLGETSITGHARDKENGVYWWTKAARQGFDFAIWGLKKFGLKIPARFSETTATNQEM